MRRKWMGPVAVAIAGLGAVGSLLAEDQPRRKPLRELRPEYRLTIRDGVHLKQLTDRNSWYQEFAQTNLHRGLIERVSPVLFTLGENHSNAWTGRLVDYLLERILRGRSVTFSYFRGSKLVSPLGVTVHGLGDTEKKLVSALLERLKHADPVEQETPAAGEAARKVKLLPIRVKANRFAAVVHGSCLSVSRDPEVAASLSGNCLDVSGASDAELQVNLAEFAASTAGLARKFLGAAGDLKLRFKWDAPNSRFLADQLELPLGKSHVLGSGAIPEAVLSALPADAGLAATVFVPKPATLAPESFEKLFAGSPETLRKGQVVPVTIAFLGMQVDEEDTGDYSGTKAKRAKPLTVVLFPFSDLSESSLTGLDRVFSKKTYYEPKYRVVCKSLVAMSLDDRAIQEVEKACARKIPSFKQLPAEFAPKLKDAGQTTLVFLNPGRQASSMLDLGFRLSERKTKSKAVSSSETVLARLPMILFSGKAGEDRLLMQGVTR